MPSIEEIRAQFPQYADLSDGDLLMGLHKTYYSDMHPRQFLNSIAGTENAHATIKTMRDYWTENVSKPMAGESAADAEARLNGSLSASVSEGGRAMTAARSGLQGLTFGMGDEIVAAGVAAFDPNRTYDQSLSQERERLGIGREKFPVTATASEIGGAVALPAAALKGGGNIWGRMATAGGVGAAEGAAYGFGTGEGTVANRVTSAGKGVAIGGVFGAAAPAVGGMVDRVVRGSKTRSELRKAIKAAPSLDDLRARARALYDQADQVTTLPRADLAQRMPAILDDAVRGGMDDVLTPGAARVAGQMDEMAQATSPTLSFRDLDIMRKRAGIPAGNTANKTEQAVASRLIDGMDDYMDAVDPRLSGIVGEARDTWGRMSRAQKVEDAMRLGDTYVSGASSGTRNKIASMLRSPKQSRGFSDVEKAALKRIANPGPVEGLVHYAGGGLGQTASTAVGAALGGAGSIPGGLAGAAVGAAMGSTARKLSEAITRRKADEAMRVIASGTKVNVPSIPAAKRTLIESLYRAGIRVPANALSQSAN